MTEDRVIAEEQTSTVKPVQVEMGNVNAVYRYQSEPVAGIAASSLPVDNSAELTPLHLLAQTYWGSN